MTEEEIKLEARLSAMEYMIGHTLSRFYKQMNLSKEALDLIEANGAEQVKQFTIPGIDPAMSDHFSDEMAQQVMHLMRITRQMYEDS